MLVIITNYNVGIHHGLHSLCLVSKGKHSSVLLYALALATNLSRLSELPIVSTLIHRLVQQYRLTGLRRQLQRTGLGVELKAGYALIIQL